MLDVVGIPFLVRRVQVERELLIHLSGNHLSLTSFIFGCMYLRFFLFLKTENSYVIVDFYKEKLVDFVPIGWVSGQKCFWPTQSGKSLSKEQIKLKKDPKSKPGENWFSHHIRIIKFCGKQ